MITKKQIKQFSDKLQKGEKPELPKARRNKVNERRYLIMVIEQKLL